MVSAGPGMSLLVVLSGFDDSVVLVSWITMLAREINFGKLLSSNRRLSRDKTEYSVYFSELAEGGTRNVVPVR